MKYDYDIFAHNKLQPKVQAFSMYLCIQVFYYNGKLKTGVSETFKNLTI